MVRVRVLVSVRVRVRVDQRVSVFICPSEPSRERVKVSHVIVECRVINHHPYYNRSNFTKICNLTSLGV